MSRESRLRRIVVKMSSSSISSRSDDFQRKVDSHISSMVESYKTLLWKGKVGDTVEQHGALQVNTAASNIIFHSNALLDQVNELRLAFLAQHSNGNEDMEVEE